MDQIAMHQKWNERAQQNAYFWVNSDQADWDQKAYYESGAADIQKYVAPFFEKHGIANMMKSSGHCLDIGCGTGRLSRALAGMCASVTGVDVSSDMVKKAKEDNANINNVEFVVGNGKQLPFVDNTFDFCFSFIVFQHFPSKTIVLNYFKEVFRTLKPGAYVKIQVRGTAGNTPGKVLWFKGWNHFYLALCLWRGWLPVPWIRSYNMTYGACFSAYEVKKIVESLGFTAIQSNYETPKYLWIEARKPIL